MRKFYPYLLALVFTAVTLFLAGEDASAQWFWKPAWPDSPSGMPDFDMNQDFDGDGIVDLNYCTPTATANSIWWYGSIPGNTPYAGQPTNLRYPALADVNNDGLINRAGADSPMNLVQNLAFLMDTNDQRLPDDGHAGTWIPSAWWGDQLGGQPGTQEYIWTRGVALKTRTYFYPQFEQVQSEVLASHDVVLHVWTRPGTTPPHDPEPEGADSGQTTLHSVTVAGVDCGVRPGHQGARIAISDPDADAREVGACPHGRVLPAGHVHGIPYSASHNDPKNVSHDGYNVVIPPVGGPGTGFGLAPYLGGDVVYATITSPTANRPMSFSVAWRAEGLELNPPFLPGEGVPPNDVWDIGFAGGANLPSQGEIFESLPTNVMPPNWVGSNQDVISAALGVPLPIVPPPVSAPPGEFGLNPGDNINALSYGMDSGNVIYFSVDPKAKGVLGTGVNNEAVQSTAMIWPWFGGTPANPGGGDFPAGGREAAGDVFKAGWFQTFGAYGAMHLDEGALDECWVCDHTNRPTNVCFVDDAQLGLQAPANNGQQLGPPEDDLDALEYASTRDSVWGIDADGDGKVDPGRFGFFSLDAAAAAAIGDSPEDILVSGGGMAFGIFADGIFDIGLLLGDDLDALILSDVQSDGSLGPNGILDRTLDEALFSLAANSPSLGGAAGGFTEGDIFYTDFTGSFSLWLSHAQLGLLFTDELNALDTLPHVVPEPATLSLLVLGGLALLRRKRK